MAYDQVKFKQHFEMAVKIRLGDKQGAASPDLQTADAAWELYEKTRTAPLGMQVFGRHKNNPSDLVGEPGIELYGEVFPKIEKKRFFGLYTGRESSKERDARVKKAGFEAQLVHPTHGQRAVSPMEFNFGVTSDVSSGSILMMGKAWNLTVNDSWLLGGVHAQQPFYLAFKKSYSNLFTSNYKHNLTITGRELLGLLLAGYELKDGGELGDVMVCKDPTKADKLTLITYATAAQQFEDPLKGKDMLIGYFNDPNTKKNLSADLLKEATDAIAATDTVRSDYVRTAKGAKFDIAVV